MIDHNVKKLILVQFLTLLEEITNSFCFRTLEKRKKDNHSKHSFDIYSWFLISAVYYWYFKSHYNPLVASLYCVGQKTYVLTFIDEVFVKKDLSSLNLN